MATALDEVKDLIQKNSIMVFTKSVCEYSSAIKELFQQIGKPFTFVDLDKEENGQEMQKELKKLTGQETVPNLFINGKNIGGFDNVMSLKKNGTLDKMLNELSGTIPGRV